MQSAWSFDQLRSAQFSARIRGRYRWACISENQPQEAWQRRLNGRRGRVATFSSGTGRELTARRGPVGHSL